MKRYFLLFFVFFVVITSCSDDAVTPVNHYQQLLVEFNASSGFNAVLITDNAILDSVRSFQGKGDYPGVDDWFAVHLNQGMVLLAGLPGQTAFYSILETYNTSHGNKELYWKSLQVKPHPIYGYRTLLGCFQTNQEIHAAVSKTLTNTQYGDGGAWQVYVIDYQTTLNMFSEIQLSDSTELFLMLNSENFYVSPN